MRSESFRIDVDGTVLDAFVKDRYGSYKKMTEETGVSDRTLRRAKRTGFISLEAAVDMCLAVDGSFEEVFGRQGERLRTLVILSRESV